MILSRVYILSFIIFATSSAVNANTILIMGDSLSAAYGIELKQGWVNLLQNKLKLEQTGKKNMACHQCLCQRRDYYRRIGSAARIIRQT